MPSSTTKQAKVMSAIAHGWHPDKGSVAKIPLKVAKEFHAADAGHKYGKGGKKKADGGAVDDAMHHVRHYAKKADGGGDLGEDTADPFAAEKFVPPSMAQAMPQVAQRDVATLRNFPTTNRPDTSQEHVRFYTGNPLTNITDEEIERGTNVALSAGTGMETPKGFTAKGAQMVGDIHDAVLQGADAIKSPELAKKLKVHYPKDIAASAAYLGIDQQGLDNLKSHMTPGAIQAFEKHYNKIVGNKPTAKPEWTIPYKGPSATDFPEIKMPDEPPEPPPMEPEGWGQDLYKPQGGDEEAGISSTKFNMDSSLSSPYAKWHDYDALHGKYASEPINLTSNEKSAVGYWGSKDGYKAINGQLRGTSEPTLAASQAITDLNTAMWSTPLKENTSVWRGLYGQQGKALKGLDVGDQFHNAGFTATSIDPRQATHYGAKDKTYYKQPDASGILVNYHLPAGYPSLYVSHPDAGNWMQAERELLLPHTDSYKIIGKETIKAPIWHRLGDVTDPNPHEYTVYHVAPSFEQKAGTQLDAAPNAGTPNKGAEVEDALQAIKESISKVGEQKPLEEAIPNALQKKYGNAPLESIPTNFASQLPAKFDKIKHDLYSMSPEGLIKTLGSQHASESPISLQGIYGAQLQKYLNKMDTNTFLDTLSDYNLTKEQWKNLFSYFPEDKISDIKSKLGLGVTKTPFTDLIDQHLNMVNWKDYKPVSADPVPEKFKPFQKKIAAAGANPNVILTKGGHEGYPDVLMDAANKPHSATKGLFLGDQEDVAKSYGTGVPVHYVARPQKPVAVVDFHDLLSSAGNELTSNGHAPAFNPRFIQTIQHIRNKYDPEMLVMHNVYDWAASGTKPATQYIVFKTNILRAPHAKFDPKKFHLRVPLAGVAGMAGAAGIYTYGDEAQAAEGKADGGEVKKKHPQIEENPQDHEFINFAKGGLIDSDIPGRTDKIPMKVAQGAYVLPADIPSALGQGNTKAGAEILKKMFTSGPYGLPLSKGHGQAFHAPQMLHFMHAEKTPKKAQGGKVEAEKVLPEDHQLGMKVPKGGSMCANCRFVKPDDYCGNKGFQQWNGDGKLPHPANEYCCDLYEHVEKKAEGGASDHVPIVTAGGEYIIHPDVVEKIGNGSRVKGHELLDKFVVHTRKEHIKTLKGLKPPK